MRSSPRSRRGAGSVVCPPGAGHGSNPRARARARGAVGDRPRASGRAIHPIRGEADDQRLREPGERTRRAERHLLVAPAVPARSRHRSSRPRRRCMRDGRRDARSPRSRARSRRAPGPPLWLRLLYRWRARRVNPSRSASATAARAAAALSAMMVASVRANTGSPLWGLGNLTGRSGCNVARTRVEHGR